MSMHDDGFGREAGPAPESQVDYDNRLRADDAPGAEPRGADTHNTKTKEVSYMGQGGAGRPGQPAMGQRSIFSGGVSPVFTQMPSYTPVTRGNEPVPEPAPAPRQPQFTTPEHTPYANTAQPVQNHQGAYQAPTQGYPTQGHPIQGYPAQPQPAYHQPAPSYQQAPSYQPAPQAAPQVYGHNAYQGAERQDYPGGQSYPAQQPYHDPQNGFGNGSDANFADSSFENAGFDLGYADASFPEPNFVDATHGNGAYGDEPSEPQGFATADYGMAQPGTDQGFQQFAFEPPQFDGAAPQQYGERLHYGEHMPADPRRAVQAFDAGYDQPPQIALGGTEAPRPAAHAFYEGERSDADFLDDGLAPPAAIAAKTGRKLNFTRRSAFMLGSALLGAIALGGALAFAYKQSGGGLGSGEPPLVQADNSPVKEAPADPGGKDFPHKNKLIYDRLQNGDQPENERLVPRQEQLAVPALPSATETAALSADGPPQVASAPLEETGEDGGPRRVKTMVVRPDGSVMAPAMPPAGAETTASTTAPAAPAAGVQVASADNPGIAVAPPAAQPTPAPQAAAAPAAAPVPAAAPEPAPAPASVQQAAVAPEPKPAAAAPAKPSKYVVQVGSKKNQTDALATFADMQQKYPTLLSSYRPMVQKADLGSKGVWYRLRIGPIDDKTEASKICGQLKSQGTDCLVMAQ